jgi:signal peptide peptidase-like protein 2B
LSFQTKQEGPNSGTNHRQEKEIFEISAKRAAVFIVVASVFLLLLFYLMSSWVTWVLIVFFCIGGIEVFSCIFYSLHFFDHMACLFVQMLLPVLGY